MSDNKEKYTLDLTDKQWEFLAKSNHHLNFKEGAVRSGKSWLDVTVTIPKRILERVDESGLVFIFGVSKSTIQRNIIEPMQDKYGASSVSDISSDNTATIFGQEVYCIGSAKSNQVSVVRGSSIKYCYFDELTEANEDVFMSALSRLDRPCSVMDAAFNPKEPSHWLKKFIDGSAEKNIDLYLQHYTIWDNPHLLPEYIDGLCNAYQGTVWYDRDILGKWTNAEGVIYKKFADTPEKYIIKKVPDDIMFYSCGIDYGGNKSAHTFVLVGFTRNYKSVVVLEEEEIREKPHDEVIDSNKLNDLFVAFANRCSDKYRCYFETNYDNAEPVLARGMQNEVERSHCRTTLVPAWKTSILDRIQLEVRLIGSDRFFVMENCKYVINSLKSCIWDSKNPNTRLDDCKTNDIDILDALEYAIEKYSVELLDYDFTKTNKGDLYAQFR